MLNSSIIPILFKILYRIRLFSLILSLMFGLFVHTETAQCVQAVFNNNMPVGQNARVIIPTEIFADILGQATQSVLDVSFFGVLLSNCMRQGAWCDHAATNSALGLGVSLSATIVFRFIRSKLVTSVKKGTGGGTGSGGDGSPGDGGRPRRRELLSSEDAEYTLVEDGDCTLVDRTEVPRASPPTAAPPAPAAPIDDGATAAAATREAAEATAQADAITADAVQAGIDAQPGIWFPVIGGPVPGEPISGYILSPVSQTGSAPGISALFVTGVHRNPSSFYGRVIPLTMSVPKTRSTRLMN